MSRNDGLQAHQFPIIDFTACAGDDCEKCSYENRPCHKSFPYELHPEGPGCPKCGAGSNCLENRTIAGMGHCPVCGWAVPLRSRGWKRKAGGATPPVVADELCIECGREPRLVGSHYGARCRKRRKREAELRYQLRKAGEEIPDLRASGMQNQPLDDLRSLRTGSAHEAQDDAADLLDEALAELTSYMDGGEAA